MAGPPDLKAVGFEAGFATTVDADDYQPVSLNGVEIELDLANTVDADDYQPVSLNGVEVESDLPVPAAGNFVMVCDF